MLLSNHSASVPSATELAGVEQQLATTEIEDEQRIIHWNTGSWPGHWPLSANARPPRKSGHGPGHLSLPQASIHRRNSNGLEKGPDHNVSCGRTNAELLIIFRGLKRPRRWHSLTDRCHLENGHPSAQPDSKRPPVQTLTRISFSGCK